MQKTCQQNARLSSETHQQRDTKELRHLFVDSYQANTLQYHNKPEEDIFPRAYHTLVHCPLSDIFNTLLELEQSYAIAIQDLYAAREKELANLQSRHAQEQETQGSNMTTIFTRQVEETELFQATWQSDILQTQQTQRQEYREFVIELYREYQSRLAFISDNNNNDKVSPSAERKKLDGKEIVAAAAGRMRQWDENEDGGEEQENASAHSSNKSERRPRSTSSSADKTMVSSIQEMGFEREQAETALMLSNQSLEGAISLLLEDPAKVNQALIKPPTTSASTPYRRSQSLSQVQRPTFGVHSRNSSWNDTTNRRHSLQRLSEGGTPSFHTMTNKSAAIAAAAGKSWNPISFLQQQKHAMMENTNLSSVRKLGGWLGKAMENLGIEEDGRPRFASVSSANNLPQLVESFTIMLGTAQIKSSHNLRLLVTDEATEIFHPAFDPPREVAYRAETATKLYTSHLSAMIVLVELSELDRANGWRQYRSGKGSNKALFERCQQSTEFHFTDIESQLTAIEQDFIHSENGLQEGSFFITKHSNLPTTQVVFHLIIDGNGLRHILKSTTHFDISSISIPLLLLPDRYLQQPELSQLTEPQQHTLWLQRRGEVVMKCIKGYLIENSRSGKRVQNEGLDRAESINGGGMRNVEFLLPNQDKVYTTAGTPSQQEVEVAFQQFRTLLVNLFRAS
ncbi:hypothetical protein K501DRAFT_240777 [Backusella circina FSU 941]|nr:hypothetical protein K501DRAFT_240777 [Backusella circina FSU 941]